jgi:hypothetical protein
MLKSHFKIEHRLLIASSLSTIIFFGCASFVITSDQMVTYDELPSTSYKPQVLVNPFYIYASPFSGGIVKYTRDSDGKVLISDADSRDMLFSGQSYLKTTDGILFKEEIRSAFGQSFMFSGFRFSDEKYGLHIDITLVDEPMNIVLGTLLVAPSILTATFIPGYFNTILSLTMDVYFGNRLLGSYNYTCRRDTWIEFFLFYFGFSQKNSVENAKREALNRMLLSFLYDLGKDNIIEPAMQ